MKKVVAILLACCILGTASADIQAPPSSRDTPVRKLSRALANIIYGAMELPTTFEHTLQKEGGPEAFSYGIVNGFERSGMRIGYGFYELVNFRTPKHHGTFDSPYPSLAVDSVNGYTEFPSQVGFASASDYVKMESR